MSETVTNAHIIPALLTVDEVAEWLRCSPYTLKHWRSIGYGPMGAKIGRHLMYRKVDVEQWVAAQFTDLVVGA